MGSFGKWFRWYELAEILHVHGGIWKRTKVVWEGVGAETLCGWQAERLLRSKLA